MSSSHSSNTYGANQQGSDVSDMILTGSKVFEEHKLERINNEIVEKNITTFREVYQMINNSRQYKKSISEIFNYLLLTTNGDYEIYKKISRIKDIMKVVAKDIFKNRSKNIPENIKELFKDILIYDIINAKSRDIDTFVIRLNRLCTLSYDNLNYLINNKFINISDYFISSIFNYVKDINVLDLLLKNYDKRYFNSYVFSSFIRKCEYITIDMINLFLDYDNVYIDMNIINCVLSNQSISNEIIYYIIDNLKYSDIIERFNNNFYECYLECNLANKRNIDMLRYLLNKIELVITKEE